MTHLRAALEIGRWEFSRWFRIRGLLTTLGVSVLISFAVAGGRYLAERSSRAPVKIAVVNLDIMPGLAAAASRISMYGVPDTTAGSLRKALDRRDFDGLLFLHSPDSSELVVTRHVPWESELRDLLTSERRRLKLEALKVTPDQLADLLISPELVVTYQEAGRGPSSVAERIASGVLILLMIIGIFNSVACQLVSITGEKQLRVTEQIISAVPPQQWMDGKILGISAYSAVQTTVFALCTLSFVLVMRLFGESLSIPIEISSPVNIFFLVLFTLGGFLFWNAFLAALAATINDPNTSSRSAILFLPLLPSVGAGLAVMKFPDSVLSSALSLLPITSPVAIPVRLVLSKVPAWEVAAGLLALVASTWYMRVLAGRIFRLGMLLYGKEPSAKEMFRWMREA